MAQTPAQGLLSGDVVIVYEGIEGFAADLTAQGVTISAVDWRPPANSLVTEARFALAALGE